MVDTVVKWDSDREFDASIGTLPWSLLNFIGIVNSFRPITNTLQQLH